ncbi:MAG: 2-oxoacid:acceptor oxidoreductase subunit alpha [Anaerolineae bacterium]|jgi:2-oxoglutarate ferredoxin oxidoreductase subunit alpha|nr:2-oxoacid:acceptor oxidoreductase subunit alpha [Anaerolineae bacterium]
MLGSDPTVVVRVGGEGGEGTITLGDLFTRIAARAGLEIYSFQTYPAEIRGGQVMYQTRLGLRRVMTEGDEADVLVAMNQQAWAEEHEDLCAEAVIIHEATVNIPSDQHVHYPIPAEKTTQALDWPMGKNFVFLGALTWLFRFDSDMAEGLIRQRMRRHAESVEKNLEAFRRGYRYARDTYPEPFPFAFPLLDTMHEERILLSGADAMALGALAGGCKFYAGYPITPATPVMESLARYLPQFGGTLVQVEDEIAAINMAIGAAYVGQLAMTATSGPGLSLMVEGLGLASMAEIPLVLVNVQRAGPSTGLPTKTSQGDLFLALYGGHGDAPRFVLAPDSVKDCYFQMAYAFSLSERFQMPVIVLSDQAMAARQETTPLPGDPWSGPLRRLTPTTDQLAGDYQRYAHTADGISPMTHPGMPGGMYLAESLEHDVYGHPDQTPDNHQRMMQKRANKVETARRMLADWSMTSRRWGDRGAPFGIVGWGSTRGAVREAMGHIHTLGIPIEAIYPHTLLPMPDQAMSDFLATKRAILVPELNFSGQFGRMIEHRYYRQLDERGVHIYQHKKEQGIPFKVREIYDATIDMIDQERRLWTKEHGELARIFDAVREAHSAANGDGCDGGCDA